MRKTRVAVIGVGVMGQYHSNIYASLPQTELVAVVDPCLDRRVKLETDYNINSYENHIELLNNENIDAVSLAAPTSKHFEIALDVMNARKHLLIEKPITANVEEAKTLIALSKQNNLVLQVGHITRFYKAVRLLKEKVTAPYLIEAKRLSRNGRIVDVGVILDLMIHDIDIVLGLIDSKVKSMTVSGHSLHQPGIEDVASAHVVFEDGCIANFLASRVATDIDRSLIISEKTQTFQLDFSQPPFTELRIQRTIQDDFGVNHIQADIRKIHEQNPLKEEISHFLDRIRDNIAPIGTTNDDLRSLELASKMLKLLEFDQAKTNFKQDKANGANNVN